MSAPHATRRQATLEQSAAAHPHVSSWVTASAGTGKTQVLTDRVLRLLLGGTRPSAILCLTFTRAAAAVMKVRVTETLARWATASDALIAEEIQLMRREGQRPSDDDIRAARRLFANLLDAPGGLRILTIHAFCESLLARFPVESGVAAHFEVMDDRTAAEKLEESRDRVLERARHDTALEQLVGGVTARVNEQRFGELMLELAKHRARIAALATPDLAAGLQRVRSCLGLTAGEDAAGILAAACAETSFPGPVLREVCAELRRGAATYVARADMLQEWLEAGPAARAELFATYRAAFFTDGGDGKRRDLLMAKKAADANPHLAQALEDEADRVGRVADRLRKVEIYEATAALLGFGVELLQEYQNEKDRHALLDYDDLILKAQALLEREGVAPWVLYKLDGGIDHILIDEAQDTSPGQWRVIQAIANEFFAGRGAYEERSRSPKPPNPRTIFAVGDAKQSIYSFLQADPASFKRMREYFAERVVAADADWRPQDLALSFRSVKPVLQAVDAVFGEETAQDGLLLADDFIRHDPSRVGQAGYVELWPPVRQPKAPEARAWDPPREQGRQASASAQVADRIARTIRSWIGNEELPARGRLVRAGDVMILVQRRGTFVEEVIRALKGCDVPVAGIDRMLITEQLPVQDLMALGSFTLLPEDNLTLASVLKGPLIGLSEELLFELAAGRSGSLWQTLRQRATERPEFAAAERQLNDWRRQARALTPHAFYAGLLARGGRRQILSRLGHEANDPIDEFLARAFEYERAHAPSLQGFLDWIVRGQVVVTRDLEVGRDEVRVLTVHGAKGLQAPIVFLADTYFVGQRDPLLHWRLHDGVPVMLWMHLAKHADEVLRAERASAAALREQEYHRLLYVAMTRAEDRLIVCGFAPTTATKRDATCWYGLIEKGLQKLDGGVEVGEGVRRWESPQSGAPDLGKPPTAAPSGELSLPAWVHRPAPGEPGAQTPLSPSRPDGYEPPALSPLGAAAEGAGIRRGVLIHRLLQLLPPVTESSRAAAAERFLAQNANDFTAAERAEMASAALRVLQAPDLAHLFGPASRAEVPVVGAVGGTVLSGQIDRLVVGEREVWIVDYKTHRPAPQTVADVPNVYRKQLAAYRGAIAAIYPQHTIRCALLWTDGPRWMELTDPDLRS